MNGLVGPFKKRTIQIFLYPVQNVALQGGEEVPDTELMLAVAKS